MAVLLLTCRYTRKLKNLHIKLVLERLLLTEEHQWLSRFVSLCFELFLIFTKIVFYIVWEKKSLCCDV